GALELRGVRVLRDGTEVLRADAVVVPGGATAAVVGRSGAGKSVLAAVAGRLLDPDEGEVLLDGVPLDSLTRASLRAEVGFAFARPVLGDGTVAEAVASGVRPAAPHRVREAVRVAGADAFVRRLPRTYDTPLADVPLSGGEYQRLGLARAFAHAGRLLVMDDATSSLDTATEHAVDRAVRDALEGTTRLVVAHRPSVAARADLVIWLEDGRVRAVGPHRRLWERAAYRAVFATGVRPGADGAAGAGGATGAVAAGDATGAVAAGGAAGAAGPEAAAGAGGAGAARGATGATGGEDGTRAEGAIGPEAAEAAEEPEAGVGRIVSLHGEARP
ncbi:ABC transporter ATP-binding protein, partial [Streptomyces sp. SID5910]|uniref:ATP-binding cassette domain-containing protein n=1 Tax=Streptomyces sp. SID5910 TaxID=2690312 RepID=UPI001368F5D6